MNRGLDQAVVDIMTQNMQGVRDVGNGDDTTEAAQALHDALYEHFTSNGEMPYGVAKARTGDPYNWIADRTADEFDAVIAWPDLTPDQVSYADNLLN